MYFSKCVIDKDEFFSQLSLISLISESTSLSILFSNLVKTLHFVSIYNFDKMNFFTNFVNIRVYSLVYFTFQISSKHFTLCQFITLFPTFQKPQISMYLTFDYKFVIHVFQFQYLFNCLLSLKSFINQFVLTTTFQKFKTNTEVVCTFPDTFHKQNVSI